MEKEIKNIGVVGARTLHHDNEGLVAEVTEDLLDRGFHIASGGAVGADAYCLSHLVHIGQADKGTVYSPWKNYSGFPAKVRALTRQFKQYGGSIIWGNASGKDDYTVVRAALLGRNLKLLEALHGLVAFIYGESKGTLFTVSKAIKEHLPIVIFAIDRDLPEFPGVRWKPLLCGGCWEGAYKAVYLR